MARLTPPPTLTWRRAALLAALAALAAQVWVLGLPFRQDDFTLLADPLSLFARFRASAHEPDGGTTFFRPSLWGLWALLRAAGGEPVRAWPFLAVGLAGHAAAAAALAGAVGRVLAPRA
ncbi:MAG: hypothetical protein AAF682_28900, partial [Planctomycetota bacterium]